MKQHYFVIRRNHWGADTNLLTAMENAGVTYDCPFTAAIQMITCCDCNEPDHQAGTFEELAWLAEDPKSTSREGVENFVISVTDPRKWKFVSASEIDGSPTYNWVGKGDIPDKLETMEYKLRLDLKTGIITRWIE